MRATKVKTYTQNTKQNLTENKQQQIRVHSTRTHADWRTTKENVHKPFSYILVCVCVCVLIDTD